MLASQASPGTGQIHALLDAISNKLAGLPDPLRESIEGDLRDVRSYLEQGALTDPEARYQELAESIKDGFYELDQDWRFTYINQRAAANVGYQPADLIGKNIWETFPDILGTAHEHCLRQVMEQRQPAGFEIEGVLTDRWYEINVYPSKAGVALFWLDITERRQAEAAARESELAARNSELAARESELAARESELAARESEARLVRSNQKISEILSSIRDDFYVLDRNWVFVYANKQFTGKVGKEPEDFIGNCIWEMFPKHVGSILYENFHASMEKGEVRRFEVGGEYTEAWYSMTSFPSAEGITVLGSDITERKRAELELRKNSEALRKNSETLRKNAEALRANAEALRISEEKYSRSFMSSPVAIAISTTADARFIEVNDSYCDLYGYRREEMIGHTAFELGFYADPEERRKMARFLAAGGKYRNQELRVLTKTGEPREVLFSTEPMVVDGQDCILTLVVDITERRRAEKALQENEAKMRAVFQALSEEVVFLNTQGVVEEINRSVQQSFGHTLSELADPQRNPRSRAVRPDGSPFPVDEQPALVALRTGQAVRDVELGVPTPDGDINWRLVNAEPVYDDQGTLLGVVASLFDITERKRADEKLHQALAEAEKGRQTLEAIMEYIPEGITIADGPDATLRMVSRYGQELLGGAHANKTAEQVADEWKIYSEDGVTPLPTEQLPLVRAIQRGEVVKNQDLVQVNERGEPLSLSCTAGPIRDAAGKITGAVVAWRDISERKKADQAVKESESRLREFLESMHDSYFALDREWRFTYANRKFGELMGIHPKDMIGKIFWELFPHYLGTDIEQYYRKVMEERVPIHYRRGGVYTNILFDISLYPTQEGLSSFGIDRTAEVRHQQQLEEERARLSAILQAIPVGVWITDADGRIVGKNKQSDLIWAGNAPLAEGVDQYFEYRSWDVKTGRKLETEDFPLTQVLRTGLPVPAEEHRILRFDGSEAIILVSATPLKDGAGRLTGAVAVNVDITRLKEAEAALQETAALLQEKNEALQANEALIEAFFAHSPGILNIEDENFRYLKTDRLTPTYFGLDRESIVGKAIKDLSPGFIEHFGAMMQRVLDTGQPETREVSGFVPARPGETMYWQASYFRVPFPGGKRGIGIVGVDITELKKAEEEEREHQVQLEIQRRLLEYRDQERQALARDLHDGPVQDLSGLLFNVQFAKEALSDPSLQLELEKIAAGLRTTVQNLRDMINMMRPPSLIRFGLAKAIRIFLEDIGEKHPEIEFSASLKEDGTCLAEPARLGLFRILQEALNNAIKHASASHVEVILLCEDQQVILEIRDDGKGFRVSRNLIDYSTNGHFGLVGMKERADAAGAAFQVQSAPGEGTTIRVVAPANTA